MKRFLYMAAVIGLVLMTVLTGCGGKEDTAETAAEEPARDTINVLQVGDLNTLDPSKVTTEYEIRVMCNIYNALTRVDKDYRVQPDLAESWEASEDGLEYTVHLREGVKFHNGEVMTADDVKYTLETYLASPSMQSTYFMFAGAKVVDENTVKIQMAFPYGSVPSMMAGLYILNRKACEEAGDEYSRNPVGTGPFEFVSWEEGQKITLKAFDDYYEGKASIENLVFKIITDSNTAYIALETGELDFASSVASLDYMEAENNPDLKTQDGPSPIYYYLGLNTLRIPDLRVRRAMNYAVNLDEINLVVNEGTGTVSRVPLLEGAEGYTTDIMTYEQDIEKAKELMAEAGYPDGGLEMVMTFIESDGNKKRGQTLQAQLAEIGIELELQPFEMGAWFQSLGEGAFDITVGGMSMDPTNTDLAYYMMFHSQGYFNISMYQDEEMDALLDEGRRELDRGKRDEIYKKVTKIVAEEALIIPSYFKTINVVYNKDLKGVELDPFERYFFYDFSW